MASRTRNYFAGLTTGVGLAVITIVVNLWLTPFILRYLSREKYALVTLANDFLTWLGLLDIGITGALVAKVSRLNDTEDEEKINALASTAFVFQSAIALLILLLGAAGSWEFPRFFKVEGALGREATWMVALLVLGTSIYCVTRAFSALLVARQQVYADNLIRLALLAIRVPILVVLLVRGWGIVSLALSSLIGFCITAVLAVVRTLRTLPSVRIRPRFASLATFREICGLGVWFCLNSVVQIFIVGLDNMLTAKVFSLPTVTTLTLSGRVYSLAQGVLQQISSTAQPMLGQVIGQEGKERTLALYRSLFAFSSAVAIVGAACLFAANRVFVTWWVGAANYGGALLDVLMAVNLVLYCWVLPNRTALTTDLKVRPQVLGRMAEAAIKMGLFFLLVRGAGLGLVAVPLSTMLAALAVSFWYMPYLTAKNFQRPFLRFVADDSARIVLLLLAILPASATSRWLANQAGGLHGALLGAVACGLCGLALMWFIAFDKGLRQRVAGALRRRMGR